MTEQLEASWTLAVSRFIVSTYTYRDALLDRTAIRLLPKVESIQADA